MDIFFQLLTESSYMEQGMLFRNPSTYGDNGFEIVPGKNAHDKANLTAKQPGDYPEYKWNNEFIKYYNDKIEY